MRLLSAAATSGVLVLAAALLAEPGIAVCPVMGCPKPRPSPTPAPMPTPAPVPSPAPVVPSPLSPTPRPSVVSSSSAPVLPPTKAMVPASQCKSPLPANDMVKLVHGCFDFVQVGIEIIDVMVSLIDQVVSGHAMVDGDTAFMNDFLRPILSMIQYDLVKAGFTLLGSNLCFGNFGGAEILAAPQTGFNSALYVDKCPKMALAPGAEYFVFSIQLPFAVFAGLCPDPAAKADAMVAACFAFTECDGVYPSFGLALNGQFQKCMLGNSGLVAATGGVAYLMSKLTAASVDSVSSALSTTDNLELSFMLYDPSSGAVKSVTAHGNVATSLEMKLKSDQLGPMFPKTCSLEGNLWVMVGLFGDPNRVAPFAHMTSDITSVLEMMENDFLIAVKGTLAIVFGMKDMSRGMFPDLKLNVGNANAMVTTALKANAGIEAGFYVFLEGNDIGAATMNAVIKTILPCVAAVIDKAFGHGATDKFIQYAQPDSTGSTRLGFALNAAETGLYLQVPVAAALNALTPFDVIPGMASFFGALEVELRISNTDGGVKFSIKYLMSKYLSMVWQDLLLVWYDAEKVFGAVERALVDFGNSGAYMTGQMFQTTAHNIAQGATAADDAVKDWAKNSLGWCNDDSEVPPSHPPSRCGAGEQFDAGLCYSSCRDGFSGAATMCLANCPSGFRDDGLYCAKGAAYGRGVGTPLSIKTSCSYWPHTKVVKSCHTTSSCGSKQDCAGLCYDACRSGYSPAGCNICSPSCPSGMADIGVSCQKNSYDRGVGKVPACASGETNYMGLCYSACKTGYDFLFGVCYKRC